ncbi:hypothetical protein ACKWTF_006502 [Chironomus riparius]
MNFAKLVTIAVILSSLTVNLVNAVQMHCEFSSFSPMSWYISPRYSCKAVNFETTFRDRILNNVRGLHDADKTDTDIKMLFMHKENCHYIPRNISGFFGNIDVLYIKDSNLQHLMTGDLDGLKSLSIFDVSYNPIDHVGEDFFKGHSSIRIISFYACHIKQIDFGAFDSLTNLQEVSLQYNYCHDGVLKRALNGTTVFTAIYLTCQGNGLKLKSKVEEECLDALKKSIDLLDDDNIIEEHSSDIKRESMSPSFKFILFTFTLLSLIVFTGLCLILFRAHKFVSTRTFFTMINEIN